MNDYDDLTQEELLSEAVFSDMLAASMAGDSVDYMPALEWAVDVGYVVEAIEDAQDDPQAWLL